MRLFDYYDAETVQIGNAALTARGALALTEERLCRSDTRVLVCGFGRIGRCLMQQFSLRGTDATVSARRDTDLAWARALGYDTVHTARFDPASFDLIYNTVPVRIFDGGRLSRMKPGALILDLSSYPYGVDFASAEEFGVSARTAPALPGRLYPRDAGALLGENALAILERLEEEVDL